VKPVIEAIDGDILKVVMNGEIIANKVIFCVSSDSRMTGLLDKKEIGLQDGILMKMPGGRAGRSGLFTSIHMLGMKFDIATFWLDESGKVVHSVLAKRWRPYYGSPNPAWYVMETHPDHLDKVSIGKKLEFNISS
jgi:hypothetical protein